MPRRFSSRKNFFVPVDLLVERRPRQPVEQRDDGALRAGDRAGQLAARIPLEASARRQVRFAGDAERLERRSASASPSVPSWT